MSKSRVTEGMGNTKHHHSPLNGTGGRIGFASGNSLFKFILNWKSLLLARGFLSITVVVYTRAHLMHHMGTDVCLLYDEILTA